MTSKRKQALVRKYKSASLSRVQGQTSRKFSDFSTRGLEADRRTALLPAPCPGNTIARFRLRQSRGTSKKRAAIAGSKSWHEAVWLCDRGRYNGTGATLGNRSEAEIGLRIDGRHVHAVVGAATPAARRKIVGRFIDGKQRRSQRDVEDARDQNVKPPPHAS